MDIQKYASQFDKFYIISDKLITKNEDGTTKDSILFKAEFIIQSVGKFEKQSSSLETIVDFIETILEVTERLKK